MRFDFYGFVKIFYNCLTLMLTLTLTLTLATLVLLKFFVLLGIQES